MSPRLRLAIPALLVVGVIAAGVVLSVGFGGTTTPPPTGAVTPGGSLGADETATPTPTPRPPLGGRELYGFVPYWELQDGTASYLRNVPLTTIALFSVGARRNGEINTRPLGYRRITGPVGRQVIEEAHARGARVELVFTSFGHKRNATFFGRGVVAPLTTPVPFPTAGAESTASPAPSSPVVPAPWVRTVDALVDLAQDLGVDGINVDIERLDPLDREVYGEFLSTLRARLLAANPKAQVSVATEGGLTGIGNAAAAAEAGVDRVFLMGYDYHWSGSQPGASSPVDRVDGLSTLRWSIDQYVDAGVPRDRIILGLPLYGMTWRTIGPDRAFHVLRSGVSFIPGRNLDTLLDPSFAPKRDPLEVAEYFIRADGNAWAVTYYDSPATLRTKLALALDNGLAGGGFWAMGYERGLPGYGRLMTDFRDGKVNRSEAPQPQP